MAKKKIPFTARMHPELQRVLQMREAPVPNVPYADTPFRLERFIALILRRSGRALTLADVCAIAQVLRLEPRWLTLFQNEITDIALYAALRTMQSQGRVLVTIETAPAYRMLFSLARP